MAFAVADAHKVGDFSPYVFMTSDRGGSWQSISADLPDGTIVWAIDQDHVDPDLLFLGTEYGIYYSHNKGNNWIKLGGGVPTIAFRDIEIHRRDNDLVGATFGRGFYILDDYSSLRTLDEAVDAGENSIFPVRDAWWYVPSEPMQAKGMPTLGTTSFTADNPPFGAVFTYYLHDLPMTAQAVRQKSEKDLREQNESIPFPGWEQLRSEPNEGEPQVLLSDSQCEWRAGPVDFRHLRKRIASCCLGPEIPCAKSNKSFNAGIQATVVRRSEGTAGSTRRVFGRIICRTRRGIDITG